MFGQLILKILLTFLLFCCCTAISEDEKFDDVDSVVLVNVVSALLNLKYSGK
jgi:hypothetical protein